MTDTATDTPETAADKPVWPLTDVARDNVRKILAACDLIQDTTGGWTDKAECRLTGLSYHVKYQTRVPGIGDSMRVMNMLGTAPGLLRACCELLAAADKEHDDRVVLRESLKRVVYCLDMFIREHPDPGTEAYGAIYEAKALLGRSEPQTSPGPHPQFGVQYRRRWTAPVRKPDGMTTFTVKRACNGCGDLIGDTSPEEIEAAIAGELPDVTGECPFCTP